MKRTGAELLVSCLEQLGVEYIFGIPGAKIDKVFDALLFSKKIKLILCRHEQNAAFMAASYGRISGKPGVVLVTSGPGVSNLTTGLLTATSEGCPVVAIGGNVSQEMLIRKTHQALDSVRLMQPVCKYAVEIQSFALIPEVIVNAFRIAMTPTKGSTFISIPQNILLSETDLKPLPYVPLNCYGLGSELSIGKAINYINSAKKPLLLLGMNASFPQNIEAITALLDKVAMPVVSTFQGSGMVDRRHFSLFVGHVGLFKNEPGDLLIQDSDLIITVGFNPIEYDPEIWNTKDDKKIIHIGCLASYVRHNYLPLVEVLGDISANINYLVAGLEPCQKMTSNALILDARQNLIDAVPNAASIKGQRVHPLRFLYELEQVIDDEFTICCDIGTIYMWFARYFFTHRPHQILYSNGQQTLGVALPWAMGCHFARPGHPVISVSGDGGFLFSAMELETAVRQHIPLIHFVWQDGSYDMVKQQELLKYGRASGVEFGKIDIIHFAKAFGAVGYDLTDINQFRLIFKEALASKQPVLINVPIDYRYNQQLFVISDPSTED